MGAAKGVHHVDVAQLGELLRHALVVLGLALVKAGVFQHQDLAGLERLGGGFGLGAGGGAHEVDLDARQQGGQVVGRHLHAVLGVRAILGAAEVAHQHDGGAVVEQVLDGGQGGADAGVVGDGAGGLVLRHVEVDADQGALALPVHVLDGLLVHGGLLKENERGTHRAPRSQKDSLGKQVLLWVAP